MQEIIFYGPGRHLNIEGRAILRGDLGEVSDEAAKSLLANPHINIEFISRQPPPVKPEPRPTTKEPLDKTTLEVSTDPKHESEETDLEHEPEEAFPPYTMTAEMIHPAKPEKEH